MRRLGARHSRRTQPRSLILLVLLLLLLLLLFRLFPATHQDLLGLEVAAARRLRRGFDVDFLLVS